MCLEAAKPPRGVLHSQSSSGVLIKERSVKEVPGNGYLVLSQFHVQLNEKKIS